MLGLVASYLSRLYGPADKCVMITLGDRNIHTKVFEGHVLWGGFRDGDAILDRCLMSNMAPCACMS